MPQPINRVRPDALVSFDSADLAEVPHLIVYPMQVIATWSKIDSLYTELLSWLIKSDFGIVVEMLLAIKSQETKSFVVKAAAKHALGDDDYALFDSVYNATKASRRRRHEYAHHLWGVPRNIPESLALLDPRDGLKGIVTLQERMAAWETQIRKMHEPGAGPPPGLSPWYQAPPDQIDYTRVQCFRKDELIGDVADANKCLELYLNLTLALFAQRPQRRDEARRRLEAGLPTPPEPNTLNQQTNQSPPA